MSPADPVPPAAPSPRVLAGYEILERISASLDGTMTFFARQKSLGRMVTMTVLPKEQAAKPELRDRFKRRVAVASRLKHANIISALDAGIAAGCLYVVFEWLEGQTLGEAFNRGDTFAPERVLAIGSDMARALDHIAANHLVHRNVVPASVLLPDHGPAKLAGLEVAKVQQPAGHETWLEHDTATALYSSPEHVRGTRGIDFRADQYSLGCVLYHAVTGRPPLDGKTAAAILARHVTDLPPDPRSLRSGLPDGLVRVLDRLLRKDPAERYAKPSELVRDLESAKAGRVVERGPGTPLWKDGMLPGRLRRR